MPQVIPRSSLSVAAAGTASAAVNESDSEARFSCNICLDSVVEPVVTQCGHLYCWPCLYRWLEPGMLPGERQSLTGGNLIMKPVDESRRVCPVCKAPASVPTIVPIYALIDRPREQQPQRSHRKLSLDANESDANSGEGTAPLSAEELDLSSTTTTATGLRQRFTTAAAPRDAAVDSTTLHEEEQNVPARPTPTQLPQQPLHQNGNHNTVMITTPLQRPLSQGIASSFHQALTIMASEVPPLHHRGQLRVEDPDATEYLSRILLLLGSFVILCLLLF